MPIAILSVGQEATAVACSAATKVLLAAAAWERPLLQATTTHSRATARSGLS